MNQKRKNSRTTLNKLNIVSLSICPKGNGKHEFDKQDRFNIDKMSFNRVEIYRICSLCEKIGLATVKVGRHAPYYRYYYKISEKGNIVYTESPDGLQKTWVKKINGDLLSFSISAEFKGIEISRISSGKSGGYSVIHIADMKKELIKKLAELPYSVKASSIEDEEVKKIIQLLPNPRT